MLSPDFGARWRNGALSNSPHLLRTLRSVDCGRVSSGGEDLLIWEGVLPCVCEAAACLCASLPSLFSRPGTHWDSCPERGGPTGHDEGDPPARRKSPHFILLHRGPGSGCWGSGAGRQEGQGGQGVSKYIIRPAKPHPATSNCLPQMVLPANQFAITWFPKSYPPACLSGPCCLLSFAVCCHRACPAAILARLVRHIESVASPRAVSPQAHPVPPDTS